MHVLIAIVACALVASRGHAAEIPQAGETLDGTNAERYGAVLDETLLGLLREGLLSIEVTAGEAFPVHPDYATASAGGGAELGAEPGRLSGYVAGRPFPAEPAPDDPRAGEKIAWNMRYAYVGDGGRIRPFYWQYRNMRTGAIERELSFEAASLRFKHRTLRPPLPDLPDNPGEIFNALYLRVVDPADIRNTQVLIHRLEDDTRQEEGWLYLGTQRRVRRLVTGQNTDAFLGSDIMIEDFLGYNGRLMDMRWRYVETREVLLPFYRHDELTLGARMGTGDFHFVAFGGAGDCFPQVRWQFRKAYVVEAVPTWSEHPLSKRLYYVDAETYAPAYGRLYDDRGELWKFAIAAYSHPDHHLPANRGSFVPILDAVTMVDLQARHCTTLQAQALVNAPDLKPSDFAVQALRVKGR